LFVFLGRKETVLSGKEIGRKKERECKEAEGGAKRKRERKREPLFERE
jgi:hypothetical protein